MKKLALACIAVLAFYLTACGQLVLAPGENWSYAFSSLSQTGFVSTFVESPNGSFTLTVDDSTFEDGDMLQYEMFQGSEFSNLICSGILSSGPPFSATCQVAGNWQDLHGSLRLTMLAGSLTVTSLTVRVVKPGPSLSSYDVYAKTFVPMPGPRLSTVKNGGKLFVSWPQTGTNYYDLQTSTNLSSATPWQNVTNNIIPLGTNYYSINDMTAPLQLFRLRAR